MRQLLLPPLAHYLRHFPLQRGKWRFHKTAIDWGRQFGNQLGTKTVRTKHGFQMELRLEDWVDQHIYATGDYEPEMVIAAQEILRPGDIAVDIGANIGFFSLLFAKCVGKNGRVISLEAQPAVYQRLRHNAAINSELNVQTIEVAATDFEGTLEFHCGPVDHSGVGSIRSRGSDGEKITVNAVRGDRILRDSGAIRLMKIDVEGAETKVIAGLKDTLQRFHPDILMEVSDGYLRESGSSAEELDRSLRDMGYYVLMLCHDGLVEIDQWSKQLPDQYNALFTNRRELVEKLSSRKM